MTITYGGKVYLLGTVYRRKVRPWAYAEIEKCKLVRPDGTQKTYYDIYVEGESEGVELTLKQAKKYVEEIRDIWFEDHPGETMD